MADDPLAAELATLRERNEWRIGFHLYTEYTVEHDVPEGDVRRLLAVVDALLAPHAPRMDRVLGLSCFTHRNALNTMLPAAGCENCVQNQLRQVCPECRDEVGDPVPFEDCRARRKALAALPGENAPAARAARSGLVAAGPGTAPGEACPAYRPGENGFRWQCMLGMAHNNPDQNPDYDDQATVHRDQFGTGFRVARCLAPAEHGRSRCWCTVPEHHRSLTTEQETPDA